MGSGPHTVSLLVLWSLERKLPKKGEKEIEDKPTDWGDDDWLSDDEALPDS
tara:strand:- start:33498 stop:33650 length:153 start_codon:yes stop_codon:yes gene_type:complete